MKITAIRTLVLGTRIDEPIRTSFGTMTKRFMILVNIQTDDGLEGWGESWSNFPAWSPKERLHTINDGLAPLLIDENPLEVSALHNKMRNASRILERQWGAPGPIAQAISAIDIALWDIKAKANAKPLFELWEAQQSTIPLYASALGPKDPTKLVKKMQALGITAFKLKLGFGLEVDTQNLRLMRDIIGDDAQLMVDANQAWDVNTTLNMSDKLAAHKISWLEEPLPADEWQNMAELKQQLPFKLAAGENIFNAQSFKALLDHDAINVAQPDVCKIGGLTEIRKACIASSQKGIPFAPHYLGGPIGFAASLHLFAGTSGGLIMEFDPHYNPLREELLNGTLEVKNGHITLSKIEGLGITPSTKVIKKYFVDERILKA